MKGVVDVRFSSVDPEALDERYCMHDSSALTVTAMELQACVHLLQRVIALMRYDRRTDCVLLCQTDADTRPPPIQRGAGKLGRSKVGLSKLGLGQLGFGKVGR